jgi:hypothetical protein
MLGPKLGPKLGPELVSTAANRALFAARRAQ